MGHVLAVASRNYETADAFVALVIMVIGMLLGAGLRWLRLRWMQLKAS